MKLLGWIGCVLLLLIGLGLAALSLGTFASLSSAAPLWLRSLGSVEQLLVSQLGTLGLGNFARAAVLGAAASALLGLSAYLKPR